MSRHDGESWSYEKQDPVYGSKLIKTYARVGSSPVNQWPSTSRNWTKFLGERGIRAVSIDQRWWRDQKGRFFSSGDKLEAGTRSPGRAFFSLSLSSLLSLQRKFTGSNEFRNKFTLLRPRFFIHVSLLLLKEKKKSKAIQKIDRVSIFFFFF